MKTRRPSPTSPNKRREDEFECFVCGHWVPFWYYNYHPDMRLKSPDDVDVIRDRCGHIWACKMCFRNSSMCTNATSNPSTFAVFLSTGEDQNHQ